MSHDRTRPALTLPADWPFTVPSGHLFYGWVIWLFSTLGFLMSVPGQTMGMAVFTDPLIEALGLSRTQLSVAYFFGTVGSALFLTQGGRWFDRLGARTVVVGASMALGATLVAISLMSEISAWASRTSGIGMAWFSFPLILLGYFGVRFTGQGLLTSASRNVLVLWFERRRGLVSGMRGIFVSLGFSLAPLLLAFMIDAFTWRVALIVLALMVGVVFAALALAFLRDSPESCGLLPDGRAPVAGDAEAPPDTSRPLREVIVTPVFWVYALSLAMHALFVTAVTFHIVSIFAEAGRSRDEALSYFFPTAVVTTSVNLLVSWLADRHLLKRYLMIMLAGFLGGAWGLVNLDQAWGYWLTIGGLGTGAGCWGMLSNLAFVRLFGRRHLGEIAGFNTSVTVFASAIGPVLFSLAGDLFGTYRAAYMLCGALVVMLLIAAIAVPQHETPPSAP